MNTAKLNEIKINFNKEQKSRRLTMAIVWSIVFLMFAGLLVYFLFSTVIEDLESDGPKFLFLILPIVFMAVSGIGFFVSFNFVSEKPFIKYVFKEVIEEMNSEDSTFYTFDSYIKNSKERINLIHQSRLFPSASVFTNYEISGYTKEQNKFKLYDLRLVSSNGQSTSVHFDGQFFEMDTLLQKNMQIRTQGKPFVKGFKYEKTQQVNRFSMFKIIGDQNTNHDDQFLEFMQNEFNDENIKQVFLSVINNKIYLAISYKKHQGRKQKTLNLESIKRIESFFRNQFALINKLEETIEI
ncbi:hypothetical protein KHQ89_03790 [Mycoplasmatota bacterium]|nr:hypothetical protein KHQ89_03790 [Mycoplasmatota bacterium]